MRDFIERSIREIMGFWTGAQNGNSGPGGARARNERFCKEKYQENSRFLRGCHCTYDPYTFKHDAISLCHFQEVIVTYVHLRNPALEAPGLEMIDFIKRSIQKIVGFWVVPKMRNLTLEAPGLEIRDIIKRSIKEIVCFWGGAQNAKSGPGGARARNDRFYKEKY